MPGVKSVILAAGFGKRLRPLTDLYAKPSIWFFDKPLIAHTVSILRKYSVGHFHINLHHRPHTIRRHLRGIRDHNGIYFSFEPVIRGTAGVLLPLADSLSGGTTIMINGDIIVDINLDDLLEFHRSQSALATLVIHPPSLVHGFPPIGVSRDGWVRRFPFGASRNNRFDWSGTFTGVQVFEPELLNWIPGRKFSSITEDVYRPLLDSGKKIAGYHYDGYWNDLGTATRYMNAHWDIMTGRATPAPDSYWYGYRRSPPWHAIDSSCTIHDSAQLGPQLVLGRDVTVGQNAHLENCLVWPGVTVPPGRSYRNRIIYSDTGWISVERKDHHHD